MSAPLLLVVLCAQAAPDARSTSERVHFAFRREHGVFVAGHDTHRIEADAAGTLSFFPISDRDVGPGPVPFRLRVSSLSSGTRPLPVAVRTLAPGAKPEALELVRADFTELVRNGPDGVEQSFRFEHPATGRGPLVLELETDARWLGHTKAGHHFAAGELAVVYGPATWVTADGARVSLRTTRTAKGLRITVPADVAARGPYPAVIDPLVSPEFGIDTPLLVPPVGQQDGPAVAFDGTNFLVVWRDFRGALGSDIYATRVDALGAILDPGGLNISTAIGGQYQPAVTFGAGQYYVSFSDSRAGGADIYGTRVSSAGVTLDGSGISLTNAAGLQVNSDVVFNGTDYLVVWEDLRVGGTNSPDIYGTRVSTAGVVLDPTPNLAISAAVWNQYLPRLDANPVTGTTLVVWEDTRNLESDIYGAMVDVAGAAGPAIPISRAINTQDRADVAFNGTNFVAVWTDRRGATADIYAARITPAGAVLDAVGVVLSSAGGDQDAPAIAGTSTQFAVWRDARNGLGRVYGTGLTAAATPTAAGGIPVSLVLQAQAEPKLALGSGQFFTAWSDTRNGNSDIYGARISLGGMVTLAAGDLALNRAANQQGQVAIGSDGTNFLVVWQDFRGGSADIYGIRVDPTGTFLDAAAFVISAAVGNESSPAVAWDGQQYVVAWSDLRTGNSDVYATRVTAAGVVLNATGIAISAGNASEGTPSVASLGAGALIAWTDSRAGSPDIYGARLSLGGVVLDATGIPVSTLPREQTGPRAIAFNGGYLLAWTDARSGNPGIYAARLDATGTLVDLAGIAVSTNAAAADSVALSGDANGALIVWRDSRNATIDIYGARLSVGGVVLDAAGIQLSVSAGSESLPAVAWDAASMTWTVCWEDLLSSSESQLFGTDVSLGGTATAPVLLSPGRNPAVLFSANLAGLLGYTRFVSAPGFNHFRGRLRLLGARANGSACALASDCVSRVCSANSTCVPAGSDAGVDAGFEGGTDAGPVDAGTDAGGLDDAGPAIDAGAFDAGLLDAGALDAGLLDAGALDAGLSAPLFEGKPLTTANCNAPWHWAPMTSGAGPFTYALRTAPSGMTLGADGSLDWDPHVGGTEPVVLVASGPGGDSVLGFEVEVSCVRRSLGVGCGCDGTGASLFVLGVMLLKRRRPRGKS